MQAKFVLYATRDAVAQIVIFIAALGTGVWLGQKEEQKVAVETISKERRVPPASLPPAEKDHAARLLQCAHAQDLNC